MMERFSQLTKRLRSSSVQAYFFNAHTIIIHLVALLFLISDVVQLLGFKMREVMQHFTLLTYLS
jgi:hypothetical protein